MHWRIAVIAAATVLTPPALMAQAGSSADELVYDTYVPGSCSPNGQAQGQCVPGDLVRIRLVPVAEGLEQPRHLAFLPGGRELLITTPTGIRVVRNGRLLPEAIAGWPQAELSSGALQAAFPHPRFAQNNIVYIYYVKSRDDDGATTLALARARLNDMSLSGVEEIFVVDGWIVGGPIAGRAKFGPDGMIYMTLNDHDPGFSTDDPRVRLLAQDVGSGVGKIMRVRDDGGIPDDNPFANEPGANPAVFTYGHRNATDIDWDPQTGVPWATEIGPMGGDELNILEPGANYGWPLVSLGTIYNESQVSEQSWWRPGMKMPRMHWTPSISPNSIAFYSGDRIPQWRGHLFIGALNGQMLQRVAFNQPEPQSERREALFMNLGRRFRHVVQGPDGYLYTATIVRILGPGAPIGANRSGIVYRIEPAE
ncbi:MAG: PQQ-dependent sugar dehydrogenase [Gammaproteobacteria bacterium]|jgi:glucose/arabinose dehydrogenase